MNELRFWKLVVILNCGVPLAILAWDAAQGSLGANAVSYAIHTTGYLSLLMLMFSLMVTPLRWLTGWNSVVGIRRALGVYAFIYAAVHLAIYFTFDRQMSLVSTATEIASRVYLMIGFAALLLMAPLALTSTSAMVVRLGAKNWKLLHRLTYVVAILGVLHFYLLVKADVGEPVSFAAFLAVLLLARVVWPYLDLAPRRKKMLAKKSLSAEPMSTAVSTQRAKTKAWSGELVIASITRETPNVQTFRLEPIEGGTLPFEFEPGQFLSLAIEIAGRRQRRSYTIASSPLERTFCELTIKREEHGTVSRHLHDNLQPGDRLTVTAPAGKFVFNGKSATSVVLIAGGVGITPLMSMARYLVQTNWSGSIDFVIVAKSEKELIFRREIEAMQRTFPRLQVHITLSQEMDDSSWSGKLGRLEATWLSSCCADLRTRPIYLCGPDGMMQQTREMLLALGVPPANLHQEAFTSSSARAEKMELAPVASSAARMEPALPTFLVDSPNAEHQVQFVRQQVAADVRDDITVLEAAESLGVAIPYECRAGVCGQCKVRLTHGHVAMDSQSALSPQEKAFGWILACQATPRTNLEVEV